MKNNDIPVLQQINKERYENIFNVYQTSNGYYYYNITNKVVIPDNLDPSVFTYYKVGKVIPWTSISYFLYGTQFLWWLIVATNKITNPVLMPASGSLLKIIKPEFVAIVLNELQSIQNG